MLIHSPVHSPPAARRGGITHHRPASPIPPQGVPPFPIPIQTPVRASRAPVQRRITLVRDHRTPGAPVIEAAALLDPLDARRLAELRLAAARMQAGGHSLFTCATCCGALLLRVRAMHAGETGGTRAHFAHRSSIGANCPQATGEVRHPDEIDARRFHGAQEGRRHAWLKEALAARLARDPSVRDVAVERTVLHGGDWRRPDVRATVAGRPTAFEVQLASPLMTTLLARAAFYARAGYDLVWLLDGARLGEAFRLQGFHDLAWDQGGHVVALEDRHLTGRGPMRATLASLRCEDGRLRLSRARLPLTDAIVRVASPDPAERPPLAQGPAARKLFAALRAGDASAGDAALARLCSDLALDHGLDAAHTDALPQAIAVLATLLTGRKADASGHGETDVAAIANVFLQTPARRPWAAALALAGAVSPVARTHLARPSTAAKLATGLALDASEGAARLACWAPLLAWLFPPMREVLARAVPRPATDQSSGMTAAGSGPTPTIHPASSATAALTGSAPASRPVTDPARPGPDARAIS